MLFTPRVKGLGKDSFLKLNDGEEVTGMFRGEIFTFRKHWVSSKGVECTGNGCQMCAQDPEHYPGFRFRINFIISRNGQLSAKLFEGGGELYDQLTGLDKKFNLAKILVDITRSGTKQNTKYIITPRVDMPVTQELEANLKAVALLPLTGTKAAAA